jgi:dimeric dUTPase (all-alpha-NTP-PPase superfamily)
MNELEKIFENQLELNMEICQKNKPQHWLAWSLISTKHSLTTKEMSYWLSRECQAMLHEIVELDRETNWKWWKKPKQLNISAIQEELMDILHFWVSACLLVGLTPKDVAEKYEEKRQENFKRQKEGY